MAEVSVQYGIETAKETGNQQKKHITPYIFISPFFLAFLFFGLVPILFSFAMSFMEWDGIKPLHWIGLTNYQKLFADHIFLLSLQNTVLMILYSLPPQLLLALVLAYILHMRLIGNKDFFQTVLFLPYITTPIAIGMLFAAIFDWHYGILNAVLLKLHIVSHAIPWLQSPAYAKPLVAFLIDWKYLGYTMVLFMAGMKTIPADIYEAAEIDGATVFDSFWRITIPLLKPIMTFVVITSLIGGFQIFDEPFLLYQSGGTGNQGLGGPDQSGLTIIMYLYQSAFQFYRWGYAAAIGYVLAIIILLCSLFSLRLMSRKEKQDANR